MAGLGQRHLRLGRADEADRQTEHRSRFGCTFVKQVEQAEERGRRVADRHHCTGKTVTPEVKRRRRARVTDAARQLWYARIAEGADDFVCRRQPLAGDSSSNHLRVAQDRRTGLERRAPCLHDTGGMLHVSGEIDHAGGVDHAYYDARGFVVETGKVGFGADGGEAAPIDFRTVANIVAHQIPSTT